MRKINKDYGVTLSLCYGKTFFDELKLPDVWEEIIQHLKKWKRELPETPEVNFDLEAEESFEEIKDITPSVYRKLLDNHELYNEIVLTIFPQKKVLQKLLTYFEAQKQKVYKTLAKKMKEKGVNK